MSTIDWSAIFVHPDGAVVHRKTKQYARQYLHKGYYAIDGNYGPVFVHRLVAAKYCGGRHKFGRQDMTVDHVDGNKLNNQAENLRWVTRTENRRLWREYQREFRQEVAAS